MLLLHDQGFDETAINLLASVTVLRAMQNAIKTSEEFEHEEQGPDSTDNNNDDNKT